MFLSLDVPNVIIVGMLLGWGKGFTNFTGEKALMGLLSENLICAPKGLSFYTTNKTMIF